MNAFSKRRAVFLLLATLIASPSLLRASLRRGPSKNLRLP